MSKKSPETETGDFSSKIPFLFFTHMREK